MSSKTMWMAPSHDGRKRRRQYLAGRLRGDQPGARRRPTTRFCPAIAFTSSTTPGGGGQLPCELALPIERLLNLSSLGTDTIRDMETIGTGLQLHTLGTIVEEAVLACWANMSNAAIENLPWKRGRMER